MALAARLEIRQGQGLLITPQLQQAIKLLQLSNIELEAYVEGELEKNPLLQRDERDNDPEPSASAAGESEAPASLDSRAASEIDAGHDDLYGDASPGARDGGEAGEERAPTAA